MQPLIYRLKTKGKKPTFPFVGKKAICNGTLYHFLYQHSIRLKEMPRAADPAEVVSLEPAHVDCEQHDSRHEKRVMSTTLAGDTVASTSSPVEAPEPTFEPAAVTPSACQEPFSVTTAATASSDRSRLFIVCGRGRKVDELRELFAACGEIRNLHFALDRSSKSRVSAA